MKILTDTAKAELIVKKSRFISEITTVSSQEEARETLRTKKAEWAELGITHLVHAFVVGPQGNVIGCSDDGEPSGTAGRPALEVLKGSGITNILLTIARYFGGIKLGTGGLVKAYGDSAKAVLALAETTELVARCQFQIQIPYSFYDRIRMILTDPDIAIEQENFTEGITLTGTMRESRFPEIAAQCRDASNGKCTLLQPEEEKNKE